ncbi:HTH-type transcriptional regulator GltC [Corynebacterium occultum]|uniref:HTH-type transcriptional regulator GltC n=2 Tax=Corynebacterium occultum TaxID=2675219 RepID=A0A6B8W7E4_9CORY|nr:HTH-type transcriptional regulator GltC [Corynebacterium occultum]
MNLGFAELAGFVAVAASGHLSDTAADLDISQPSLSRRIARVEAQVGATLFDRHGRRLRLNSRGRAFLPQAEAALAALDNGVSQVRRLMDPEHGTVRLDFMHSLGTWLVPELLRSYRSAHPGVHFSLHQDAAQGLVERVLDDTADIALVGPRPTGAGEPDSPLGWVRLSRQRLAIALPEDHRLAGVGSVPIRLAEVAGEDFISMRPGYGTRLLLDELFRKAELQPSFVFESMELSTVAGLVSAGLGVALLPMDDPYLAPTGVVLRPLDPPAQRELGMVWRRAEEPAPPVDQFRAFVAARVVEPR